MIKKFINQNKLAKMLDSNKTWDFLEYLKDPYHVWNFQRYFGVQKVQIVDNCKGAKFQVGGHRVFYSHEQKSTYRYLINSM